MPQGHALSMLLWACSGLVPTTPWKQRIYWRHLSRILLSHFLKPRSCFCNLVKKTSKCKIYLFSPLASGFNFPLKIENNIERQERREPVAAEQDCDKPSYTSYGSWRSDFHDFWTLYWFSYPNSPAVAKSEARTMSSFLPESRDERLTLEPRVTTFTLYYC